MVTWVLLKVARMFATPDTMFFACLALTISWHWGLAEQFGGGRRGGNSGGVGSNLGCFSGRIERRALFAGLASAGAAASALTSFPSSARLVSFFFGHNEIQ